MVCLHSTNKNPQNWLRKIQNLETNAHDSNALFEETPPLKLRNVIDVQGF